MATSFRALAALVSLTLMFAVGCSTSVHSGDAGQTDVVSEDVGSDAGSGSDTMGDTGDAFVGQDTVGTDADMVSQEIDSGSSDAAPSCAAELSFAKCGDNIDTATGICCLDSALDKTWLDTLAAMECVSTQSSDCTTGYCTRTLVDIHDASYVPKDWSTVIHEGQKEAAYADKVVIGVDWGLKVDSEHTIISEATASQIDLWSAQRDTQLGYFVKDEFLFEKQPNGSILLTQTSHGCQPDGTQVNPKGNTWTFNCKSK